MKIYESFVLLLGFLTQILGNRITLDDDAQALCKKYKLMCKTGKVCAVQHFDEPKPITIPVCIPLSFVPATYKSYVRNLICQLPPDPGRCFARYIRWYYNIHTRDCSHFRYGGCHGNQNNFMSRDECQRSCLATPSIKLFEGGQSALVQMKPSIMTAPVYEPPRTNSYEALNSVIYSGSDNTNDRYSVLRHRTNKNQPDEANTRKRRRLDREKERRRRERRKEKKRLKRLRQRQRNLKKGKKSKKNKKKKKRVRPSTEVVNETTPNGSDVADKIAPTETGAETKDGISNEIEVKVKENTDEDSEKERKRKRKKRRNKDRKKRDRYRSRRHRPSYRRYGELKTGPQSYFSILERKKSDAVDQRNSLIRTLS